MAGSAVRRRLRSFRSMWRHEQMSIKMAIAKCAHHSVQTDTHRPKVAVFDQGIQVGVPRHHEFDVDSSPMSSDPVASDYEVGLAPAFVDDSTQALALHAVAEYAVPIFHFSWERVCVVGSFPFHFFRGAGATCRTCLPRLIMCLR